MKNIGQSTREDLEQHSNLPFDNVNNESRSSSSHVQRYINTLAAVEETQRSLLVESTSLPIFMSIDENVYPHKLIRGSDGTHQYSSNIREMYSESQKEEFQIEIEIGINTLVERDYNTVTSHGGSLRHTTETHLNLDAIQLDTSHLVANGISGSSNQYQAGDSSVNAAPEGHEQVENTPFTDEEQPPHLLPASTGNSSKVL